MTESRKSLIKTGKENLDKALNPSNNWQDGVKKNSELEKAAKILDLEVSIKCSYDTTTVDLSPGIVQKLEPFLVNVAKAKEFIDNFSGNATPKAEQQKIYNDKKTKLTSKLGQKWANKLAKLPVTITVTQPKFVFGVAWGRKPLETATGYGAPVSTDIMLKASPLFGIEGSLDLITCAGFIPVAGQIITVLELVLTVVGVEPIFKLYASGTIEVSGKGTIHYDDDANNGAIETHTKATMKLGIEASVTAKAGVVGFIFSGGSIEGLIADNTYLVSAETGFTADFGQGINFGRGPYIEASLGFSGLIAKGTKKTQRKGLAGTEKEYFNYVVVDPKPDLIGGTYYFNE